jgi:hypothetical protein
MTLGKTSFAVVFFSSVVNRLPSVLWAPALGKAAVSVVPVILIGMLSSLPFQEAVQRVEQLCKNDDFIITKCKSSSF